jgi:tetratricopeptide (TPR) repeat protein
MYAPAWNEWGNVLVDLARPAEADPFYYRSLAFDGGRAVVHHNLGVCLRQLGRASEAERCFRRAIAIDPAYFHSLEELGILCLERGEREAAGEWLRRAGSRRAHWFLQSAGLGG